MSRDRRDHAPELETLEDVLERTRPRVSPGKISSTMRLQRVASDDGPVSPARAREHAADSSGAPLPAALASEFSASLGVDLSPVRVHTDAAAGDAAAAVSARAFATGDDIYFAPGTYDPASEGGRELIAHEVAHTVQQRGGGGALQARGEVSETGDPLEREADAAAADMVAGRAARAPLSRGAGIQRDPGDARGGGGAFTEAEMRTLARRPPAEVLGAIAERDPAGGVQMMHAIAAWHPLVRDIPRGAACPPPLRRAMYALIHAHAIPAADVPAFFRARFDVPYERVFDAGQNGPAASNPDAEQEFTRSNDPEVLDRVWWQLDRLPDGDVSENSALDALRMCSQGVSNNRAGSYDPASQAVVLDENADHEDDTASSRSVEGLVRHEVGHAVHERMRGRADAWLRDGVRFRTETPSADAVRRVIDAYGGFPATYHSGDADLPFEPWMQERIVAEVTQRLASGGGGGSYLVFSDPRLQVASQSMPEAMGAFRAPSSEHLENRPADGSGVRHAYSSHYRELIHAGPLVGQMIDATGRSYAGSAPAEFFAECYVEYYGDPASLEDASLRGGALPGPIKSWFDANVSPPTAADASGPRGQAGPGGAS